jgi:hypothetical protein
MTIIFCDAKEGSLLYAIAIVICFEAVSGLEVNLGKSEIVLAGMLKILLGKCVVKFGLAHELSWYGQRHWEKS